METKEYSGKITGVEEKKGAQGPYCVVKIDGKNFLYKGEERPSIDSQIKVKYTEHTYTTSDGERTSKWIQGVEIIEATADQNKDPSPFGDFTKGTEVKAQLNPVERMKECIQEAIGITEAFPEEEWSTEDKRSMGISLFIEKNRR